MIRRHTFITLFFILATSLLALYLLLFEYGFHTASEAFLYSRYPESYTTEEFMLSVTAGHTPDKTEVRIHLRQDETGEFYLFLPTALYERGLRWSFPSSAVLTIDGRLTKPDSSCQLTAGTHQLNVTDANGTKTYPLHVMFSSPIAALFLETASGSLDGVNSDKNYEESGYCTLFEADGSLNYDGKLETIKGRGNSSWTDTDKKSYQIKLANSAGLLSMGSAKRWVLLANAFDRSLLRNAAAFSMAESFGLAYTPQTEYVDVYANGEYLGNYLLSEKIEIGKNRIAVTDLEKETENLNAPADLTSFQPFMTEAGRLYSIKGIQIPVNPSDNTGGYLLELETSDRYGLEISGFMTSRMQSVVIKSPACASEEQATYIAQLYQDFEDAVFSEDGFNPYTGAHYTDYIDMDSFIRKYLLEEICKNLDAAFTSQYLYKPKDSVSTKLFAGPIWDYDKAIAASGITQEGIDLHDPNGLYAAVRTKDSDLWYGLYSHEDFRKGTAQAYFNQCRAVTLAAAQALSEAAEELLSSAMMNAYRWDLFAEADSLEEKQELYLGCAAEMEDFLLKRLAYLDSEWEPYRKP